MDVKVIIISSLISGIIGVLISIYYHKRAESRRMKLEVLRNFVGYRFDLRGDKFTKTLNEIFIVFQDSRDVLEKLNNFHEVIITDQKVLANDKLHKLFKAMCGDIKINTSKYDESTFLKAFNIKQ